MGNTLHNSVAPPQARRTATRRLLPPAIPDEVLREAGRLRALVAEGNDEASRKRLHDLVVAYRLGNG